MTHTIKPLDRHCIAVTGGFGHLGRAVAQVLIDQGARVALLDKADAPDTLASTATLHLFSQVDLSSPQAAKSALDAVVTRLGRLDGLVNVAGGFRWETIADGSIDTWDLLYNINLRTTLLASQAALPHLLANGSSRIVNVGALAAEKADKGMGAYAASKAAVARLPEALAEECKDQGITVNAVLPSIIDTLTNRADMPNDDPTRWVRAEQLAQVIAFLLQDAASAITGALIPVRGRV